MRSDVVMRGYRNLPDKTAEAIDADGWLHTGDIATIDDDGYVTIVDRKKEIIINAAGKNMSPANIEATVKSASPLIGNAVCIGDARPYDTALIVLDPDFAPMWAAQDGTRTPRWRRCAATTAVRAELQRRSTPPTQARPRRADQEVHDRARRLGARRRRADPDDEAQAQADRGEVRRRRSSREREDERTTTRPPEPAPEPAQAGPMEWASAMGNQAVARLARQAMEPELETEAPEAEAEAEEAPPAEVEQLEAEGIGMDALASLGAVDDMAEGDLPD